MVLLRRRNGYGIVGADRNALAAPGTALLIQQRRRATLCFEFESDRGLLAGIAAASANHSAARKTGVAEGDVQFPGRSGRVFGEVQGLVSACFDAVAAEGAVVEGEVDGGIAAGADLYDLTGAGADTIVAALAEFGERPLRF